MSAARLLVIVFLSACALVGGRAVLGAYDDRLAERALITDDRGELMLLGNDGWFHARHARRLARALADAGGPSLVEVARLDAGCDYPTGLRTIHVSLFDLALAVALRASGVDLEDERACRAVLARAGPVGAALAALFAAALTATLTRELVGHTLSAGVAAAAAALLLRAGATRPVRSRPRSGSPLVSGSSRPGSSHTTTPPWPRPCSRRSGALASARWPRPSGRCASPQGAASPSS